MSLLVLLLCCTPVALLLHWYYSCHTDVALVSPVSHLFHPCCTRVARAWHSCCKLDYIFHENWYKNPFLLTIQDIKQRVIELRKLKIHSEMIHIIYARSNIHQIFNKLLKIKVLRETPWKKWQISMNLVLITRQKSFTNCSVGLRLDPRNVRLTKWLVCKVIWQSEQFPDCNMTSAKDSFKANFIEMYEFLNWTLKKYLLKSR